MLEPLRFDLRIHPQTLACTLRAAVDCLKWCDKARIVYSEVPCPEIAPGLRRFAQPCLDDGYMSFPYESGAWILCRADLQRAIQIAADRAPHVLTAVLYHEGAWGETADQFLQYAVFGEVRYP